MFDNIKIAKRLSLGFGVVFIFFCALTIFAINRMHYLADNTTLIYNHPLTVSNAVLRINTNIIKIHRSMKDVVLSDSHTHIDKDSQIVDGLERDVYADFDLIGKRFLGNKALYERAQETFVSWKPIRDEVITLMFAGKVKMAVDITRGKGAEHVVKIENAMDSLDIFAQGKASEFLKNAESTAFRSLWIIYTLLFLVMVVGAVFTFYITRSITRPLESLRAATMEIGKGRLNTSIEVRTGGEIGELANSFANMIASLSSVTASRDELNDELNKDIIERKQAEESLKAQKEYLERLHDSIGDAVFTVRMPEREIEFVNKAAEDIFGYRAVELVGRQTDILYHEDGGYVDYGVRLKGALERGEEIVRTELLLKSKNGDSFLGDVTTTFIREDGELQRVISIVRDITERKQAEEELSTYKDFYDNAPNMFVSVDAKTSKIIRCNQALANALDYTKEQLIGKPLSFIYHCDCEDIRKKVFRSFLETSKVKNAKLQLKRKDGSKVDVALNVTAVCDEKGEVLYSRSVLWNITERKRAEESLKAQKEYLERLHDSIGDAVFTVRMPEREIEFVNKAAEDIFGYRAVELVGRQTDILYHEDGGYVDYGVRLKGALERGEEIVRTELLLKSKNGESFLGDVTTTFISEDGELKRVISIVRDITERKRAEEELRLQSRIITGMAEGAFLIRASDGVIVYTNPRFEKMFGYGTGELIGKEVFVVNAPTDKSPEETAADIIKALKNEGVWSGEVRNIRKDGTPFWCFANVSTMQHPIHGEVWIAIHSDITERKWVEEELQRAHDELEVKVIERTSELTEANTELQTEITERKRAEEELRESNELFRQLSNAAFEGIVIHKEGKIVAVNMAFAHMFGYAPAEAAGMDAMAFVSPGYRDIVQDNISSEYQKSYEAEFLRKDGLTFTAEIRGRTIRHKGRIARVTVVRDITERKRAEEALVESEENYRSIFERNVAGIVVANAGGGFLNVNPAFCKMLGYSEEEMVSLSMPDITMPEDMQKSMEMLAKIQRGEVEHFTLEKRYKHKSGSTVYAIISGVVLYDEEGKHDRIIVTVEDITERKHAEDELRFNEERFRALSKATFEGIVFSKEGVIFDCNEQFSEIVGYSLDELMVLDGFKLVHLDDLERVQQIIFSGSEEPYSLRLICKDGSVRDIEVHPQMMTVKGEDLRVTAVNDITEHKKAEEALLAKTMELDMLNKDLHDLTMEITTIEDAERKRFAEILHDGIGQQLVAVEIGLSVCIKSLDHSSDETVKRLSDANVLLRGTIESIRSMSSDLYTMNPYEGELLGRKGFIEAAAWYVENVLKPAGVTAEVDIDNSIDELSNDYKLRIYRILQESFQNVVKHASASSVKLRCKVKGDRLLFSVKDNGVGHSRRSESPNEGGGVGLRIMRERVTSMKGRLTINSVRGEGTEVVAEFPWSKLSGQSKASRKGGLTDGKDKDIHSG